MSFYSVGYLPAYFLIYYYYSWRPIVIASLVCGFTSLMFSCTLVESPRFLGVVIARYSRARSALEYIAFANKKIMFPDHLQGEIFNEYSETIRRRQNADNSEVKDSSARDVPFEYLGGAANAVDRERELDRGQKLGYRDLLKEDLRMNVCVLVLLWFIQGLNLYIYMQSTVILNEKYSNLSLFVIISLFGFFVGFSTTYFINTRKSLMILSIVSGIFSGCQSALIFTGNVSSGFFSIGILFICAFQFTLILYSLETIQTPARCIGFGGMYFVSLIGILIGSGILIFAAESLCVTSVLLVLYPILLTKLPEKGLEPLNDFMVWSEIS